MAGLRLNRSVEVGENWLIGTNTIVREGLSLHNNSAVGAGSVVLNNLGVGSVVYGNPPKWYVFPW